MPLRALVRPPEPEAAETTTEVPADDRTYPVPADERQFIIPPDGTRQEVS